MRKRKAKTPTRCSISVSASTFALLKVAAEVRGKSKRQLVEEMVNATVPVATFMGVPVFLSDVPNEVRFTNRGGNE